MAPFPVLDSAKSYFKVVTFINEDISYLKMQVSGETFVMGFVAVQARILYAAQGQEAPDYTQLMAGGIHQLFRRGGASEISTLFDFAGRDLAAVLANENFCPREYEFGTDELAAYETAQKFSQVVIGAIESTLLYGGELDVAKREREAQKALSSLRDMSLTFRLAEGMYRSLEKPREHFPLHGVREYAFDQHEFALGKVLGDVLAPHREEFESAITISASLNERTAAYSP